LGGLDRHAADRVAVHGDDGGLRLPEQLHEPHPPADGVAVEIGDNGVRPSGLDELPRAAAVDYSAELVILEVPITHSTHPGPKAALTYVPVGWLKVGELETEAWIRV
jgi:hypothetical protein